MSTKLPFVSIVVVSRDADKYIKQCINSLLDLDYPKNKYEMVIVDGMSIDRSQDIIKSYKRVKLVLNPEKIIGPGRNIGIKAAKGEFIAFTDSDCVVKKDWLKTLVGGILSSEGNVVAVGGPNKIFDDDPFFAKLVGYSQETFIGSGGSAQSYNINKPRYVTSIPNCNILYKKEIIKQEGYDNRIKIGEDMDLNFRLTQKGYKFLFLPNAIVWHRRRNSLKSFVKNMFYYGDAMIKVSKKNKKIVRPLGLAPAFMIIAILLTLPFIVLVRPIVYAYIFFLFVYLMILFIATFSVFRKLKGIASFLTLLILPVQHISYGLGVLYGSFKRRLD